MSDYRAFISYTREHESLKRDWLKTFANALRDRNVIVWIDTADIKLGDDISVAMETALRESDVIIAIIPHIASETPWVYFELGVAIGASKRLIVVADPSSAIPPYLTRGRLVVLKEPEETAREVAEAIDATG